MNSQVLMIAVAFIMLSNVSQAQQFNMEQYLAELNECVSLPTVEEAQACHKILQEKYVPRSIDENASDHDRGEEAALVFRCNIPALSNKELGSRVSVWKSKDRERYYVASDTSQNIFYQVKGFGTPGSGDFSLNFVDGRHITIASNGWTTTSEDEVRNKNSLYGAKSSVKNVPTGECIRSDRGVQELRTF